MSEKNNINEFDLMMKSVLDEAREAVPERVWEGVSSGLEKAARRRTVVLWWRRAAVGIAAAAVVVLGVFFTHNTDNKAVIIPVDNNMIAVVTPGETEIIVENDSSEVSVTDISLLAKVDNSIHTAVETGKKEDVIPDSAAELIEVYENEKPEPAVRKDTVSKVKTEKKEPAAEPFPTIWEDEKPEKKKGVSLVLSGIAGTNNAVSQNSIGPMMRPSVTPAPKRTGIEETSTKSSYGIPLSFGVGVKFDLSPRWSIGTGINYTYLARQFYGKYTKVTSVGDIESVTSSDIRNQQHYIGIPVNAYYSIINNDRINFYAYAGGAVEKCVSDSYRLLNTNISHREKVSGVQLSADAGIGVEFMLGKHLGLYIDPSVRYYFKNGNQPKSIRTVQPLMLGFEMGLRARL